NPAVSTRSLHAALPISRGHGVCRGPLSPTVRRKRHAPEGVVARNGPARAVVLGHTEPRGAAAINCPGRARVERELDDLPRLDGRSEEYTSELQSRENLV